MDLRGLLLSGGEGKAKEEGEGGKGVPDLKVERWQPSVRMLY